MNSPFLVVDSPRVRCVDEPGDAVIHLVVRGRWDGGLRQETSQVLRACIAGAPRTVLVDLAQLRDPAGESASTWHTAGRYATQTQPPVTLVICAAEPAIRHWLSTNGGDRVLALIDSVDAARAMVTSTGGGVRHQHLSLSAQPRACALARRMVGDACLAFDAPRSVQPARLIVSELVANGIEHAGSALEVWVSRRGATVHLAVQDGSPELPRVRETEHEQSAVMTPSGMGLRVVAAAAMAWGCLPCRDGKVVWATVAAEGGVVA